MEHILSFLQGYMNLELIQIVLFSVLCGSIFGLERQKRNKSVGLRTTIFVCLGAALFSYIGLHIQGDNDKARVIAQIVSGTGFICGGVIFKSYNSERLIGLTTAAILWVVASIGCMISLGMGKEAVGISILIFLINVITYRVEKKSYKLDNDIDKEVLNFFLKDEEYKAVLTGDMTLKIRKGLVSLKPGTFNFVNINHSEHQQRGMITKIEYKKFNEITESMVLGQYLSLGAFQDDFSKRYPDIKPTDDITMIFLEI